MDDIQRIRFITYLSPGIPLEFYEAIAAYIGDELNTKTSLANITGCSGPTTVGRDPLSKREADIAFLSAPSYLWLKNIKPSPVVLLGAAPAYADERLSGKPGTFCEVVVANDGSFSDFSDLEGCLWAYTDLQSLTGYYAILRKLDELGVEHFFSGNLESGSPTRSLEWVLSGEVDMAAIDSNVLQAQFRANPEFREELQILTSLGPYPIQPIVARSGLPNAVKDAVERVLLAMSTTAKGTAILKEFKCAGFAAPDANEYQNDKLLAHYGP